MKEILLMAKSLGKVNILFLMENIMKVIFKVIYMREKEYMNGLKKEGVTKGNFIWEIWKEMGFLNLVMELFIKVIMLEELSKGKEAIHGIMVSNLLEIG